MRAASRSPALSVLLVAGVLFASRVAAQGATANPADATASGSSAAAGARATSSAVSSSGETSGAADSREAPSDDAARPIESLLRQAPSVERLRNGLQIVTLPWPSPGIVSYYTLVRVGSRDEVEPGHSGFAHFFEHMMFRGTERYSSEAYDRALQSVGADHNAFTTSDYTCYTITAPTSALPLVIDIESDRFQNLAYSEEAFRTEAGAVRGEYQVWSSNPAQPMWETLSEIAFARHTYRHTTIGYLADIDAMPTRYEYSRRFFARYYTPDATILIVVGDFDRDALLSAIRDRYGAWRGRRDRPRIPVEPAPRQGASRELSWPASTPPRVFVGYRIPAFDGSGSALSRAERRALLAEAGDIPASAAAFLETAALDVVHGLVFDTASPLYQRLVVERQTVLDMGSNSGDPSRDPGLFIATGTLAPGQDPSGFVEAVQSELSSMSELASAARVRDVQSHYRYAMAMRMETPSSVASFLANMLAVSGAVEDIDDYLVALDAVTPAMVNRVASTYLVPERRFVVSLTEASSVADESGADESGADESGADESGAAAGGES